MRPSPSSPALLSVRWIALTACLVTSGIGSASPARAISGPFTLGVRIDIPTGANPNFPVLADLNGDGRADLVVTSAGSGFVSVFLTVPNGLFGPRTDYPTAGNPRAVAVADFNGDGKPDIAVACYSGAVSIFYGDGAGGFSARTDVPEPFGAYSIAAGDLNGDGRPDLVVGIVAYPATISVLLANGAGGFAPHREYSAGAAGYIEAVALGDLNGDGALDVIAANTGSNVEEVLLGDGSGGLGAPTAYNTDGAPLDVLLSDLDNDGNLDFLDANAVSVAGAATYAWGTGLGGFSPGATAVTGAGANYGVAVGDFNRDGYLDFVATGYDSSRVFAVSGQGSRQFVGENVLAVGANPWRIAVGDVNGDGLLDIVTADYNANAVTVLLGNPGGGFAAKADLPANLNTNTVAIADMNGDGKPDLVVVNQASNGLSIYFGNGNGGFTSRTDLVTNTGPRGLAIADMNGDGALDIVIGSAVGSMVSYFPGNGLGGFGTRVDLAAGTNPQSVVVADVNRDGRPDILAANHGSGTFSVLLGNSSGGFNAHVDYITGLASSSPNSIVVGDLGANRLDVITANPVSNNVTIAYSNNDGTYSPDWLVTSASIPYAVALGDFNGDGRPDLAVAEGGANDVMVLLGTGGENFGTPVHYATGVGPASLAVADVNGDGQLDLVVGNNTSPGSVSVLLGDGKGGFGPRTDYPTGVQPYFLAIGDLNGDGRPDIVSANYASASVSVLLGLRTTQTGVVASPNPVVQGGSVALTATVSAPSAGAPSPTDSVSFYDGTTLLGGAPVVGGAATLSVPAGRLGARPISARYQGDAHLFGSFSSGAALEVVATAKPTIASVSDVGNDQGDAVRVRFLKSPYDYPGSGTAITRYDVYRQIAPGEAPQASAKPALAAASLRTSPGHAAPAAVQLDGWDFVGTTPATTDSAYDLVVPTLADSNASGTHDATFLVRAQTGTPSLYFDSAPDSGYAVDNLPPAPPAPFTGAYVSGATDLQWGGNREPDFWYYALYKGASSSFVPGAGNRIATLSQTSYADPGPAGSWYKLSAIDVNGNESGYAVLGPDGTTAVGGPRLPATLWLSPPNPNPASGGATLRFGLPRAANVDLAIYDPSGRRVRQLVADDMAAGERSAAWDARDDSGAPVGAGLYFARLRAGGETRIVRFTVLR